MMLWSANGFTAIMSSPTATVMPTCTRRRRRSARMDSMPSTPKISTENDVVNAVSAESALE